MAVPPLIYLAQAFSVYTEFEEEVMESCEVCGQ